MSRLILEANDLQVSFGDRQLLNPDHLAVYSGDRIGLIGENGAGKTTLLRMLQVNSSRIQGLSAAWLRSQ